MSEWIKLYAAAFTHPKTRRLAKRLNIAPAAAVGHLSALWSFTAEFAPDGDLGRFDNEEVELGAGWEGEDGKFIGAAKAAGYLVERQGSLLIHDWSDYGGKLVERRAAERKRSAERRATAGRPQDDRSTTEVRPLAERREREEREKEPPLPPQPVDNSADQERGCSTEHQEPGPEPPSDPTRDAPAASQARSTDNLEALRNNPTCEDRECAVRTLRCGLRGTIAQIVGPAEAGNLYNESTPLHRTLAGTSGYICAAAWKASAAATMEQRQPLCRKAMVAYVDSLYDFHRQKPIRSLPAFLKTRYGNMTEAPVSDELLAELRKLERTGTNGKGEPVRIGEVLPIPVGGWIADWKCLACDGDGRKPDKTGGGHHGQCPECLGTGHQAPSCDNCTVYGDCNISQPRGSATMGCGGRSWLHGEMNPVPEKAMAT